MILEETFHFPDARAEVPSGRKEPYARVAPGAQACLCVTGSVVTGPVAPAGPFGAPEIRRLMRSMGIHYIDRMKNAARTHTDLPTLLNAARGGSRQQRNALALEVLKQFRLIYGTVRRHFRRVEATCGVSGSQLWLMQEIELAPGAGVSELARRLSIHQTTCSLLVEKLVSRGYVRKERSTQDQRRVGLTLSRRALNALGKAPGPAEGLLPEALAELPNAALESLSTQLRKVIAELRLRDERSAGRPLADL